MSSNDGCDSDSPETSDPLYIENDSHDSNSVDCQSQPTTVEIQPKKKKRNPVCIYDHITILSGDPPLYECKVCLKKFKTKAHIKYHEFCQNGEKPFKCEQCGQGFIAKSHYEYHLRTHTGERPYVCPKCGKGFNQRGKVTRHMRSHTGEKPFICQQCGRGFANSQALRSHFLIHTGERPFACTYCNKRFTGMTNLKKHVITHTGERPFSCIHCGKSFGLKWTLDLHLRTHSTERPFACDQCTRAFSNSKDLRRHMVIHSGERPFKCWICGTAFRRKDNLDRHIKNTHNQPKEVAKQLANEAAAEYLASSSKKDQLSGVKASASKSFPLPPNKKATSDDHNSDESHGHKILTVSGPNKPCSKKGKDGNICDEMVVLITSDLVSPGSPKGIQSVGTVGTSQSIREATPVENSAVPLHSISLSTIDEDAMCNLTNGLKKPKSFKKGSAREVRVDHTSHPSESSKSVNEAFNSKGSKKDTSGIRVPRTSRNYLIISSNVSKLNEINTSGKIPPSQTKQASKISQESRQDTLPFGCVPKKDDILGDSVSSTSRSFLATSSKNNVQAKIPTSGQMEVTQIKHTSRLMHPKKASKFIHTLPDGESIPEEPVPSTSRSIFKQPLNKQTSTSKRIPLKIIVNKKTGISRIAKPKKEPYNSSEQKPKPVFVRVNSIGKRRSSLMYKKRLAAKSQIESGERAVDHFILTHSEITTQPKTLTQETINSTSQEEELTASVPPTNVSDSGGNKPSCSVVKMRKKRKPVNIYKHITILGGEEKLYKCNICSKKFKTKAHIKYHEFCGNGEKPFKCEQCGQGFIAKSHYEYHLRTHTGERPYVCPKCGKGFNQRGKVTRHMRSHTGEKPFICQQCGRGFANSQALRSHFLIHTGERPFACKYCTRRFTGMTNLKKHIITHTGERPYSCTHCGKSFGIKWTLDLHMRTHSTERPFACDQCSKSFSNSKDLRRHMLIHSGERPFKCWICGTSFRRKDNLDRHIKNTHNQPKEIAKKLADEAAAEYYANTIQVQLASANADVPAEIPGASRQTAQSPQSSSSLAAVEVTLVDPVPSVPSCGLTHETVLGHASKVEIPPDLSPDGSVAVARADTAAEGVSSVRGSPDNNSILVSDEESAAEAAAPAEMKVVLPQDVYAPVPVPIHVQVKTEVDVDTIPGTIPHKDQALEPEMECEKSYLNNAEGVTTDDLSNLESIFSVGTDEDDYILPNSCHQDIKPDPFIQDMSGAGNTETKVEVDSSDYESDLLSFAHLQYFHHIS